MGTNILGGCKRQIGGNEKRSETLTATVLGERVTVKKGSFVFSAEKCSYGN